jgi:phosphatidylglycerophosphate synthase
MAESTATEGATVGARRPIAARDSAWAARVTRWLVENGITPNAISLASVGFALVAACAIAGTRWAPWPSLKALLFFVAIVGIQSRLLCNLFDGMVAVEGGKGGKAGEVFNDFPDRIADPLIFIATGCAAGRWGVPLGWLAAVLAVMTAYLRVLGRSLGAGTYFIGPMAKQHRMAVITVACAIGILQVFGRGYRMMLSVALAVICLGCIVTMIRRTQRIVRDLESR